MTITDYIRKTEEICKREFMTAKDLVALLGIAHNTLIRIRRAPETCSMNTLKKFKKFVDGWEAKKALYECSTLKEYNGTINKE